MAYPKSIYPSDPYSTTDYLDYVPPPGYGAQGGGIMGALGALSSALPGRISSLAGGANQVVNTDITNSIMNAFSPYWNSGGSSDRAQQYATQQFGNYMGKLQPYLDRASQGVSGHGSVTVNSGGDFARFALPYINAALQGAIAAGNQREEGDLGLRRALALRSSGADEGARLGFVGDAARVALQSAARPGMWQSRPAYRSPGGGGTNYGPDVGGGAGGGGMKGGGGGGGGGPQAPAAVDPNANWANAWNAANTLSGGGGLASTWAGNPWGINSGNTGNPSLGGGWDSTGWGSPYTGNAYSPGGGGWGSDSWG